jgi:hypothetical protein
MMKPLIHLMAIMCFLVALPGCSDYGDSEGTTGPPQEMVTGQAAMGPLCDAEVALYQSTDLHNPLYSTVTRISTDISTAGTFDMPKELLQDNEMYVVAVTGGYGIDTDNDGVLDETNTPNKGSIHLVATGAELKQGNFKVNILTELVFNQVGYLLAAQYPSQTIVDEMDRCSRLLLTQDLNGDAVVDHTDLVSWSPIDPQSYLLQGTSSLEPCTAAVYGGESMAMLSKERLSGMITTNDISGNFKANRISFPYAYVLDAKAGLCIFDMEDIRQPVLVGAVRVANTVTSLAVADHYAYVGCSFAGLGFLHPGFSALQVVDITHVDGPVLAGYVTLPSEPGGVVVSGHYAYAACGGYGLQIIDVSDPEKPVIASYLYMPGSANDIVMEGTHVFVANGDSGFSVIDVSDPTAPFQVATVNTPLAAKKIAVSGSYAYVVCATLGYSGLQVIDISEVEAPKALGFLICTFGEVSGVAVSGHYAYLVNGNYDPVIVDVTDPTSLRFASTPTDDFGGLLYRDVAVYGNYAYLVGASFHLLDISAPDPVACLGTVNISSQAVAISGNYAYVLGGSLPWGAGNTPTLLGVIDITDRSVPLLVGQVEVGGDFAVEVSNGLAYVAAGTAGMQIVDVSTARSPVLISTLKTSGAEDVAVSGNYAYVADGDAGLRIVDITQKDNPAIVGGVGAPLNAKHVSISGHYAIVTDIDSGVHVIDVSDPQAPMLATTLSLEGQAMDVAISGNYAFVADGSAGLKVIDISDPLSPTIVGEVKTLAVAWHVAVSGNYAYVADYYSGFQIIDISDVTHPVMVGYVDSPGYSFDLAITDGYAYVAFGLPGLKTYKIPPM